MRNIIEIITDTDTALLWESIVGSLFIFALPCVFIIWAVAMGAN